MKFSKLEQGHLLERENRFRARVAVAGRTVLAHVADPGRLAELLVRGRRLWLSRARNLNRKTAYDVVLVEHRGHLVCINTRYPNDLVQEALGDGVLYSGRVSAFRREVMHGNSRFDFLLTMNDGQIHWLEIKAVSLVRNRVALFPDAPTVRGTRHVRELTEIVLAGGYASVIFVLQRGDADSFTANCDMDPAFAEALCKAIRVGVDVQIWACQISTSGMRITHSLPLVLDC